ncbi:MAG: RnfABCDGE type electron transport complex subunit D [bacterium]
MRKQYQPEQVFAGKSMPSIKKQLIILLLALALYVAFSARDFIFLKSLSITAIAAVVAESAILYFKNKKLSLSESSIISGLIVGFVLSSDSRPAVLILASVFAISSKYLIRVNKRHIFNPAGLGILLAMLFFGANSEWRGTYLWSILLPAGFYLAYKIRKLSLVVSYFLCTFILFGAQALWQKTQLINILGVLSYFFIFIMLVEPKTTPLKTNLKIIFGAAVAGLIFILSNLRIRFDAELASLLFLNLFVLFLNRLPEVKAIKI